MKQKILLLVAFAAITFSSVWSQTATQPSLGDGTSGNPWQIATLDNLYWLTQTNAEWVAGKYFIQTADIDASTTSGWDGGAGFSPIGGDLYQRRFSANYDGQGHTISGLYIARTNAASGSEIGMFGIVTGGSTIQNLIIQNMTVIATVQTSAGCGMLIGGADNASISNITISGGSLTSGVGCMYGYAAPLVGSCYNANITNCNSSANVTFNVDAATNDVYKSNVAGLIGFADCYTMNYSFSNCYASGNVTSNTGSTGGFIGTAASTDAFTGSISECYSSGNVTTTTTRYGIGGFVGSSTKAVTISNCYSTGDISSGGGNYVGGFFGTISQSPGSNFLNCYSTGSVSGFTSYGSGFGGYIPFGTITNCFWDTESSTQSTGLGYDGISGETLYGEITSVMKTEGTFTAKSWDFTDVWSIDPGINGGYPYLQDTPPPASASTITWDGSESAAWNTAGNWDGGVIPTSADNVIIANAGTAPVVAPGVQADCNDLTVNSGASLTIQSTAAGTGSLITNGASTGDVTIQRYVSGSTVLTEYKYHLVSVPLTPATTSTSNLFLGAYLFNYDVTGNAWNALGTSITTELDETKGYMIYTPQANHTYTFTGPINAGEFSPTVVHAGQGFNLVPNPYTSALDWDAASGWTKTNIDNATYIWSSANSNYAAYIGGTGANNGTQYIPGGQAFFVKTNAAAPVLTMTDAVRVHNSQAFWKSGNAIKNILRVNANANNYSDEAVVRFADGATTNMDAQFDATKMFGLETAPQLYTLVQNEKLTINSLPFSENSTVVPLSFTLEENTSCTLTFSEIESFSNETNIYLEDLLTGVTINLRQQNSYTFDHLNGNDPNRFNLHFTNITSINETGVQSGKIWMNDGSIYINAPEMDGKSALVEIFNITGQKLYSRQITIGGLTTINTNIKGIAIVKLTSDRNVITAKGIIK